MQLTLYLMRNDVEMADPVIRERSSFRLIDLRPIDGIEEARLYVKSSRAKEPRWISDIRPLLRDGNEQLELSNQASSGVLLLRAHERLFALTFGRGFQAVNSKLVHPGFGLRVTANSVAANQVIGGDMMGYGKGVRNRRIVLPEATELYQLGIEPNQEWVKRLSGKVDPAFAARAVGADSLRLNIREFSLRRISGKLGEILTRHDSVEYRNATSF